MADECVMMADRAHPLKALLVSMETPPGMIVEGGESNGWSKVVQLLSLSWPCLSSVLLGFDIGPSNSTVNLSRSDWFLVSLLHLCLLQVTYMLSYYFFFLLWSLLLAVGGLVGYGSPWTCQPTSRKSVGLSELKSFSLSKPGNTLTQL